MVAMYSFFPIALKNVLKTKGSHIILNYIFREIKCLNI